MDNLFELIAQKTKNGKDNEAVELVKEAIEKNIDPKEILDKGLIKGMNEIGNMFQKNEAFIPDMLIASRAMKRGLEALKPYLNENSYEFLGKIIVGTVKGDLHDIGKNLVSIMYESAGFKVVDLGIDVDADKFIDAIREYNPKAVSLSALLTTTMNNQKDTLKKIKENFGDSVKVLVGGAPVTKEWADSIGADGFAKDAYGAAQIAKALCI